MATEPSFYNHNLRVVTTIVALSLAIAGSTHGFFEMLQGNVPTGGFYINSIGADQQMWGDDPAITLIQNFFITGITAMAIGAAIAIWSVFFVHRPRGPLVLLLLFSAQTLAGGGIGYIPYYLATFAWATRINKPPLTWPGKLPKGVRTILSAIWLPTVIVAALLWAATLIESVAGLLVPTFGGNFVLTLIAISLLIVMILFNLAFTGAAVRDAEAP